MCYTIGMENTTEAPVQNEVRPPDSMETRVYGEGKKVVNLTCAKFQVAKGLESTTLAVSTRSQRDDTEGRLLQGNAMYNCLLENGLDKETQLIIIGHSEGAIVPPKQIYQYYEVMIN